MESLPLIFNDLLGVSCCVRYLKTLSFYQVNIGVFGLSSTAQHSWRMNATEGKERKQARLHRRISDFGILFFSFFGPVPAVRECFAASVFAFLSFGPRLSTHFYKNMLHHLV